MKILFLDTPSFAKSDLLSALTECGIRYDLFFHKNYHERSDSEFSCAFDNAIEGENYTFVLSFNYFPIISNCCMKHNLKYVAYIYDSPLVTLYSYSILNPCNYIFIFDKFTYQELHSSGISNVYYLPLAANVKRLSSVPCNDMVKEKYSSPVSFVGTMYNEEHNLFDRLTDISDYTRGYLDSIMHAQQKVYGNFFLEELLTEPILADMQHAVPYKPMADGVETDAYVYANYFLARKITATERQQLLNKASQAFRLKLYTPNATPSLPYAQNMGTVDYYDEMPLVFHNSKINLNITLRSIKSGIPLRCMDILGSKAFLLTNYQADFDDFFLPNEDYVYYESEDDFLEKIKYYLSHENERNQIVENSFGKMLESHTFVHRIQNILNIVL